MGSIGPPDNLALARLPVPALAVLLLVVVSLLGAVLEVPAAAAMRRRAVVVEAILGSVPPAAAATGAEVIFLCDGISSFPSPHVRSGQVKVRSFREWINHKINFGVGQYYYTYSIAASSSYR
jgi:hypothetical protein